MADEPMTVDHDTNGEEASVPTVNGVVKVEVSLDAKETVSDGAVVDIKSESKEMDEASESVSGPAVVDIESEPQENISSEPQEMDEVSESALKLNYDEASIGDQSKNNSRDDTSTPPVDAEENGNGENSGKINYSLLK